MQVGGGNINVFTPHLHKGYPEDYIISVILL